MHAIAVLMGMALTTGCGLLLFVPPDWVTNRESLPLCGEENFGHGEGFDPPARACLLEAFQEGRSAELISIQLSVEGDSITRYLRVHENGTIEFFVDATRDRFGSGAWERLACQRLVPVAEYNDPPDTVLPSDMLFVEDGCEPSPSM